MHIFSPDGEKIKTIGGKGASVRFAVSDIPQNSIITHNHPRSIGKTGIRAIGNSFSPADIRSAVLVNAKEIRAVTPTYTFSVKRPDSGWGTNADSVKKYYSRVNSQVNKEMMSYLNKVGWKEENIARAEVTHFHLVMKKMAKKYGWSYTKKRG